jgi:hypothetical protein
MTTSPAEPVDNDQSGQDEDEQSTSSDDNRSIDDDQLPDELQPREDNPLATPEGDVSEAPKPQEQAQEQGPEQGQGAVPEGEVPPGEPSIG